MLLYIFWVAAISEKHTYQLTSAAEPGKVLTLVNNKLAFEPYDSSFNDKHTDIIMQNINEDIYTIMFTNGSYLCRSPGTTYTVKVCNEEDGNKQWTIKKDNNEGYTIQTSGMCLNTTKDSGSNVELSIEACTQSKEQSFAFVEKSNDKIAKYDDIIKKINDIEEAAINCKHRDYHDVIPEASNPEPVQPKPTEISEKIEPQPEHKVTTDDIVPTKECPDLIWEIRMENKLL
ncbi:hypothetical protein BDAP_000242 [Binucleata daphniae]